MGSSFVLVLSSPTPGGIVAFNTARGQVRLLIADLADEESGKQILTDDMVDGYLRRWGVTDGATENFLRGPVGRAAADALDAIATSEALTLKVLRTADGVTTDGAKLADALRKQAAALRAQADKDDLEEGAIDDVFGVVEFTPYPGRGPELSGW